MSKTHKVQSDAVEQMPLTKAVKMTLASLRLEGVILSAASIADLQSVESGKLSQQEAIAKVLARIQK